MNVIVQRMHSARIRQSRQHELIGHIRIYQFPVQIQTLNELLPLTCIVLGISNPDISNWTNNEKQYRKSMFSDLTNLRRNSSLREDRLVSRADKIRNSTIDKMRDEG